MWDYFLKACCCFLTEGLHGLNQLEGEGLVSGQVFKHTGDLVVPRPDDVTPIDALYVVADADHLHLIRNAAVFDTLPHGERTEKEKVGEPCNYRTAKRLQGKMMYDVFFFLKQ